MATSLERFWEDLLLFIEERRVVPIVGPDLAAIQDGPDEVSLYRWIGTRLAPVLDLGDADLPADFGLNDVVSLHLRRRGEKEELYPRILSILRGGSLRPSRSLQALAGIQGFDLFVSLTFDSLLADVLAGVRGGTRADQVAYSPNAVADLPRAPSALHPPTVFHLLGKASSSPDYAICDEDLLEFLHAMQDKQRQPKMLFDELRNSHLLILGCSFGDWLARFFLRTARNLELSQKRKRWDVVVGGPAGQDPSLASFLESFSPETRILPMNARQFVSELSERWQAAHPAGSVRESPANAGDAMSGRAVPAGAIFVSYASEDAAAAGRLVEGMRAAHLDVWFDKDALQMGEDWARGIRRGIERCSLFVPVVSKQALSEENRRRYFWREWNDADDFARGMAPGEVFIIPVVVDDTRMDRAALPESFKKAQAHSFLDGVLATEAAGMLAELVRDFHRRRRSA